MKQRFKRLLKLLRILFPDARYRAVIKSGLFDAKYYLRTNSDVAAQKNHPLIHYMETEGLERGRNPNPFFDPCFYQERYPECRKQGFTPLHHYIFVGWKEGKRPSYFFDPEYYLSQIDRSMSDIGNPLIHFLTEGITQGLRSTPFFDPVYYMNHNPEVDQTPVAAYTHYLEIGAMERRRPSLLFDSSWYEDRSSILKTLKMDLIQHYIEYGVQEGKSPNPLFDPIYYRTNNHDIEDSWGRDSFRHYVAIGLQEDRRPCCWFDPKFYRKKYSEELSSGLTPMEHYLQQGVCRGLYSEEKVACLPRKPLISIVIPVYNVAGHYLNNCLRSILYQSYPHWECCLCDDCSSDPGVWPLLEQWAATDSRFKVARLPENRGIVTASNTAADMASGEYLGFLDNDDELAPECLYEVVHRIVDTSVDLIYTDEDLTGDDGRQFSVFRKPDFNRELLLTHNYITHFMVTEAQLFKNVGGFSPGCDGAQDYDFILKASEHTEKISHIAKVLYHWRASATSTSINHAQKDYANRAGRLALTAHMQRQGMVGEVTGGELKYFYRVKRELLQNPTVSIIIRYQRQEDPKLWVTRLLQQTAYPVKELVVCLDQEVKNNESTFEISGNKTVISWFPVLNDQGPAIICNEAAKGCTGDYLIFLNGYVSIAEKDWIEALLAHAQEDGCGAVGGRIELLNDGLAAVQTLPVLTDFSALYYKLFFLEASSHMNGLQCSQNVLAVSWLLCMIKRDRFFAMEGFNDKTFPHLFGDLDMGLRLHESGFANVSTPYCTGRWEGFDGSFMGKKEIWLKEKEQFQRVWRHLLKQGDPYYNLGLIDDNGMDLKEFVAWYAGISNQ